MNFEEHAAKPLLRAAGIDTPQGALAATPAEAAQIADKLGPCVLKAQVPIGKRGKAGGIKVAASAAEAESAAAAILGMSIGGHRVEKVLVEAQVPIAHELYAAVLNDPASKGPLLLFSARGGMDIEEIAAAYPDELVRVPVDIRKGVDAHILETNAATGAALRSRAFCPTCSPASTPSMPAMTQSWSRSIRWSSPGMAASSRSTAS